MITTKLTDTDIAILAEAAGHHIDALRYQAENDIDLDDEATADISAEIDLLVEIITRVEANALPDRY